jgi:hypothetical protein
MRRKEKLVKLAKTGQEDPRDQRRAEEQKTNRSGTFDFYITCPEVRASFQKFRVGQGTSRLNLFDFERTTCVERRTEDGGWRMDDR